MYYSIFNKHGDDDVLYKAQKGVILLKNDVFYRARNDVIFHKSKIYDILHKVDDDDPQSVSTDVILHTVENYGIIFKARNNVIFHKTRNYAIQNKASNDANFYSASNNVTS